MFVRQKSVTKYDSLNILTDHLESLSGIQDKKNDGTDFLHNFIAECSRINKISDKDRSAADWRKFSLQWFFIGYAYSEKAKYNKAIYCFNLAISAINNISEQNRNNPDWKILYEWCNRVKDDELTENCNAPFHTDWQALVIFHIAMGISYTNQKSSKLVKCFKEAIAVSEKIPIEKRTPYDWQCLILSQQYLSQCHKIYHEFDKQTTLNYLKNIVSLNKIPEEKRTPTEWRLLSHFQNEIANIYYKNDAGGKIGDQSLLASIVTNIKIPEDKRSSRYWDDMFRYLHVTGVSGGTHYDILNNRIKVPKERRTPDYWWSFMQYKFRIAITSHDVQNYHAVIQASNMIPENSRNRKYWSILASSQCTVGWEANVKISSCPIKIKCQEESLSNVKNYITNPSNRDWWVLCVSISTLFEKARTIDNMFSTLDQLFDYLDKIGVDDLTSDISGFLYELLNNIEKFIIKEEIINRNFLTKLELYLMHILSYINRNDCKDIALFDVIKKIKNSATTKKPLILPDQKRVPEDTMDFLANPLAILSSSRAIFQLMHGMQFNYHQAHTWVAHHNLRILMVHGWNRINKTTLESKSQDNNTEKVIVSSNLLEFNPWVIILSFLGNLSVKEAKIFNEKMCFFARKKVLLHDMRTHFPNSALGKASNTIVNFFSASSYPYKNNAIYLEKAITDASNQSELRAALEKEAGSSIVQNHTPDPRKIKEEYPAAVKKHIKRLSS